MKDKLIKVKRKHVDWNKARLDLADPKIDADFFLFLQQHPGMSKNRCAYNVLKRYYSTTAMLRYRLEGKFCE